MEIGTVSIEGLQKALDIVHRQIDLGKLVRDEHLRFALYVDALAVVSPEDEKELLSIVLSDPDVTMRDSAVATRVDRIAVSGSAETFKHWIDLSADILQRSQFVTRRAREWLLFKEVQEGNPLTAAALHGATDWLQRKLSEEASSATALEVLKREGRTKRIRNIAASRLEQLRRTM